MDYKICAQFLAALQLLLIKSGYCDVRTEPNNIHQYCQNTVFNATCAPDEIVVMTSALYGRMRIGKCVEVSLGYLGCKTDVLDIADGICSGHQSCEITVPNGNMDYRVITDPHTPCMKEMKNYLETTYTCVKALVVHNGQCNKPMTVRVYPHTGVLSGIQMANTGCGSVNAPWVLEAMPGQVLNISLLDFHWKVGVSVLTNNRLIYGSIIDLKTDEMVTINGGGPRTKHLYLSKGHRVQIAFHAKIAANPGFVISYHALGCPNLNAPKDGWLLRKGSELVIGCNNTKQTWHLLCKGLHWTGVIGNCSMSGATLAMRHLRNRGPLNMPHGLAIFIVAAVSVALSCAIILVGFVCIRRFNNGGPAYNSTATMHTYKPYPRHKGDNVHIQTNSRLPKNDYMHIWDQPLPEPVAEEYQHPAEASQKKLDQEISNMKIIKDEMSRGLEKYMQKRDKPESAFACPKVEDKTSGINKRDSNTKLEPGNLFITGKECDNPDCVCFVGYEPSCGAHSSSQ